MKKNTKISTNQFSIRNFQQMKIFTFKSTKKKKEKKKNSKDRINFDYTEQKILGIIKDKQLSKTFHSKIRLK